MRKFYCCVGILCVLTLSLSAIASTPKALSATDAKVKASTSMNAVAHPAKDANIRVGGDTCETATVIAALPYSDTGSTADATDDYDAACTYTSTSPDVVYAFTPAADVVVDVDICDSSYDTKLFVYEGACDTTEIACNEDSCGDVGGYAYASEITALELTANTTYYFVVDGYDGASGAYAINVVEYVPPTGRCCADDTSCTETTEAECVGTWTEGLDCTTPCPEPLDCMFGQRVFTPDESWTFGTIATEQGQIIYDNFSGMTAPIQDITIWALDLYNNGSAWSDCDYAGQLQVIIYEDNNGVPGTVVSDQTVSITSSTATGDLYSDSEFESKEIVFSITPVMQASGWISIQSVTDGCWLLWGGSPEGDGVCYSDDGEGLTAEDADRAICLAGEYVPEFGACCDDATGSCSDNVELIDCQGRFVADTLCADLDPQCGIPGACCDDLFGECLDDVNAVACPSPQRHAPGMTCSEMTPECGQATGACCNPDGTCEQTTEMDCNYNFLGILTDCSECPCVVNCPEGSVLEQEACGDNSNGGCNADPYVAETISAGDTVCGTVWSSTETRDTDWYDLVLATDAIVTLTAEGDLATANGGLAFGLINTYACDDENIAFVMSDTLDECEEGTLVSECIPAGTYRVFVAAGDFIDNPCDNKYTISVAVEECVVPRGACCYGDAECYEDLTEDECTIAGGREWHVDAACSEVDCPEMAPGANCDNPIVVDAIPYTDNNTTCGMNNDYSDTEMGYYDGGEDTVYVLTVTEATSVILTLDPNGTAWTAAGIFDACPDTGALLTVASSSGSAAHSSECVELTPGTYYVMVSTWPSPDCIESYTLSIDTCTPPTGRCCYDGGHQCDEVTNAECDALGGAWDGELTCADACPIAPENDTCEGAFEICCGTLKEGTTVGTIIDGGPSCTDISDDTVETPDKEVWYTFIGTGQEMTVHMCGTTEDTIIAVYEGTCGELVCVAADDDSDYCEGKALQSAVTLCTEPLKRYFVAVWDYGANDPIDFVIGVNCGGLCTQGACCKPDGCEETFEMECTGLFLGAGSGCDECPVFECTGTEEAEDCGDETNDGCNSDNFDTEAVDLNSTVCGTVWADDSTRDTDWYQITLTEASVVEITAIGEFPLVAGIVGNPDGPVALPIDCDDDDLQINPYTSVGYMEEGVVTTDCLPAGTYVVFASLGEYADYPCDNNYKLEITATACTPRPRLIRPTVGLFGGAIQQAISGEFVINGVNSIRNTPENLMQMELGQNQIQIMRR